MNYPKTNSPWLHAEEQSAGLFCAPMSGKSTSDIHPKQPTTLGTTYDVNIVKYKDSTQLV